MINLKREHSDSDWKAISFTAGFSLIELLTVISIISILSSMLLPALSHAKSSAKRVSCINHIKQLAMASLMYADDDRYGSFSGRTARNDQDMNWLLPYAGSTKLFSCPATRNFIREKISQNRWNGHKGLTDLMTIADTKTARPGSSYIGYGFFGRPIQSYMKIPFNGKWLTIPFLRRTINNVTGYRRSSQAYGLYGSAVGPSEHWIFLDNNGAGKPFYPDEPDNHGPSGGNVGFCDGHAEWVKQSEYLYRQELSQDRNWTGE
ncbi:prepilin-type N-terminal cleavage/methylation domain-containing protein [Verrucomicrobia bacterium]|nr:prepilin-type N-terminal cleavage/methylation domain-containing protein [Verrucomicrobiota bacterium]